jgi:hypothetical protein
MSSLLRALLLFLIVSIGSMAIAEIQPQNPRVVWLRDPATTAMICWNTNELGSEHRVHVHEHGAAGGDVTTFDSTRDRKFSYVKDDEQPLFFHHAEVTGLKPGTRYDIQVVSDGQSSPRYYFVTAPGGETAFSLLFGGDSRTGHENRRKMNAMMSELVARTADSPDPADRIIALMHGGDYVESGTKFKQWKRWMADHDLTIGPDNRILPIIPARGNHDRGRLFCQAFGFDSKDSHNWYAQSFGGLLSVVTLNTESSIAGKQAKWLGDQLKKNRANHRWLIVQYHRPAYAAVKWPSGALIYWVPRFENHNVDLVCEADGHNIKRTMPIRKGKPHPEGVVYIGEGGLGVPQRTAKKSRWYIKSPGMADSGHHVQRLRFEPHQLTYECLLLGGEIRDTATLLPRGAKTAAATTGS